ncbi:hypothetical protein NQ314_000873 [Rhamnusium bicolor]|uniref:Uncharacterized protein n=1 Tax=Rhamnusium bicolor TaxID=1586634 RepID=A0AAV8ZUY3_9CUCU|nr:hypothetical protein NQ314_000873 [Rhamnusium bicolor]
MGRRKPKSKQNVQRVAQKQGAPQNNNQKPAQASVPQPQPAKAHNKSHKKNELNQKGANKEGTDMDAFNDNGGEKEEVNANVTTNSTNNDIINANSVPVTNNATTITRDVNVNIEPNNKRIETNEVVTIKMEPVKPVKTKVDITDIVKEKPKPIKPFTSTESNDEVDRVAISADKLVQAKNEANAKVNSENNGHESKYNYKEGQWSPSNPSGNKIYHRDLLLAIRNSPASQRKPDNIHEDVLADGRGVNNFSSPYVFAPPKRNSQSGKMGGGSSKETKPKVMVTISVREEVKLHSTKNAWRPARLNKGEFATDDDKKTEELYKKVRGVLNKLTPQKFETLLSQIKSLHIDTAERLQGVIDLVFEKAVDEPNFSVAYANMCSELALMQTRSGRNEKLQEIENCADPEKRKDLGFELDEYDRRLRMKSVGNIRFIGELFKQNMLTVSIMQRCLKNLLDNKDEESLECLCKLLTTIGKELETKNVCLNPIFDTMKNIADKKEGNVSSRIRFMLQDVIDLRNSRWIPRRQDLNPKTIDQIKKEADSEQMNIQMMNSASMAPRKDERGGSGPNSDRKGRGRNVSDDGWIMNTNRNRTQQFTVQSDKLKSKAPQIDEPLGSSQLFGGWSKGSVGSNTKAPPQSLGPNTANMYAPLENMETEKRPLSSRPGSKEPYSSKGPSLERNYNKSYDGRGSRSGSQHRSNDSSASSSQRSTPAPIIAPAAPKPAQSMPILQLTQEQMERRINNSLDEYVTGSCSVEEYFLDIGSVIPLSYYPQMIEDSYLHVLEKSQQARSKTGALFAKLIRLGKIQLDDYCTGLEGILSQADDLKIDIPKFWDYLAEILVDVICEEVVPLSRLHKSFQILISQGHAAKMLAPLFNFIKDNQFEFLIGGGAPVGQNQLSYEQIQIKLSEFLKARTSLDDIVNWITANVGDRIKENKFIRALATAIFQDSISKNFKLMSETLSAHNNLLLKYVDNTPTYELQCLYALQALIHKMEHPQGLLLSICDKLYEVGTFSQESFIAWEVSNDATEQEGKG